VLDGTAPANTAPVRVDFEPGSQYRYSGGGITMMTNGDKALAIANYKKSLELNAANSNGTEMLKKLEAPASKQPD